MKIFMKGVFSKKNVLLISVCFQMIPPNIITFGLVLLEIVSEYTPLKTRFSRRHQASSMDKFLPKKN